MSEAIIRSEGVLSGSIVSEGILRGSLSMPVGYEDYTLQQPSDKRMARQPPTKLVRWDPL